MLNIISFVSAFIELLIFILGDHYGRKKALILLVFIGITGALIGVIFDQLVSLTMAMTMVQVFYEGTLNGCFIYLNELIINPLRSKSIAIKSIFISLGIVGKYTFAHFYFSDCLYIFLLVIFVFSKF